MTKKTSRTKLAFEITNKVKSFLPYYLVNKKFVKKDTLGFLFGYELKTLKK